MTLIIGIIIGLLVLGLLGKIIGLIWTIVSWILGGLNNLLGCLLWVFIIFCVLIVLCC